MLRYWVFGSLWCSVWLAVDVWLCTASILNLCAISLDRYLAISRPFRYHDLMTPARGKILVGLVWVLSFIICFPPLLGWNEHKTGIVDTLKDRSKEGPTDYTLNTTESGSSYGNYSEAVTTTSTPDPFGCELVKYPICGLTSDPGYIIYSALGSFFIPVIIMSFFYCKIYRTAARTTSALKKGMLTMKTGSDVPSLSEDASVTLRIHRGGGSRVHLLSPSTSSISSKRASSIRSDLDSITSLRRSMRSECGRMSSIKDYMRPNSLRAEACSKKLTAVQMPSTSCDSPLLKDPNSNHPTTSNSLSPQCQVQQNGSSTSQPEPKSPSNKPLYNLAELRNKCDQNKPNRKFGRKNIRSHLRKLNKEKKAAKTVGIIVGCFIVCWMPFFTIYLLGAFCMECTPPLVFSIFFWLGYCNSAVNPCIYALFSKDFRYAFRNLLVCKCKRQPSSIWHFLYTLRMGNIGNSKGSDSNSE